MKYNRIRNGSNHNDNNNNDNGKITIMIMVIITITIESVTTTSMHLAKIKALFETENIVNEKRYYHIVKN